MVISFLLALGFIGLLVGIYLLAKHSESLRFFYSPCASVFSTIGVLIATIGLGLRFYSTSSIFFLSFSLFFLFCLGLRCVHEIAIRKPLPFVCIHCGLFLFLLSLSFGSLSLDQYYMMTRPHIPELRALDIKTGEVRQLPIAIDLQSFDISYHETDITQAMEGRPELVKPPVPKKYIARVKVYEYEKGETQAVEDSIEVNSPLKVGNFHIYNTSFDPYGQGSVTFLLVKDPWLYITYFSIFLSLLGGIVLFIRK